MHEDTPPLKDSKNATVIGKGIYCVSRGNKTVTLMAESGTNPSALEVIAKEAKSRTGLTVIKC